MGILKEAEFWQAIWAISTILWLVPLLWKLDNFLDSKREKKEWEIDDEEEKEAKKLAKKYRLRNS